MPKPNALGRQRTETTAPEADGSTQPPSRKEAFDGRHHIALLAALVVSSLTILAIPIARSQARAPDSDSARTSPLYHTASAVVVPVESSVSAQDEPGTSNHRSDSAGLASIPHSNVVPSALIEATTRAVVGSILGSPDTVPSLIIERRQPWSFTLHTDGFVTTHVSAEATVAQALSALGITLSEHDSVSPIPSAQLSPGAHIYVRHAISTRLVVGSVEQEYFTHAKTVAGLLAEAGVGYESTDRVFPSAETAVRSGMLVHVTTIRNIDEVTEEALEFDTVYQYDPDRPDGEFALVQAGSRGSIHRQYRVRLINGNEVKRELVTESVSLPTEQILVVGTYVAPTPTATARPVVVAAPPGAEGCARTLSVYATWYTAASAGGGTTATGTGVYKGIVAVDPRVIPLGTRMYIPGYGYGLAADTGGAIKGNMIDLGYGPDDIKDWRTRWVDICILP